jgi:hypothetical protein
MALERSTAEALQEVVESGRVMLNAGQRMVRGFKRLRESPEGSQWKLDEHPYLILGASIGALFLIGALLRSRD